MQTTEALTIMLGYADVILKTRLYKYIENFTTKKKKKKKKEKKKMKIFR